MTSIASGNSTLWFFGTGDFAAKCFSFLAETIAFSLVVTPSPSRGGRGLKTIVSPVEKICTTLGLPVYYSSAVSSDEFLLSQLAESPPLAILVVDFGQKILEPFLSAPLQGCLNIHPSLLPMYRGAAPVQRALLNGDLITGVTVFRLTDRMDAGPVLFQEKYVPREDETAGEVLDVLAKKGSKLFLLGVKCLVEGTCSLKEQDSELASYAPKITNNDIEISWEKPARKIVDMVRALNPLPGSFLFIRKKRVKIWSAEYRPQSGLPGEVYDFDDGFPVVGTSDGSVVFRCVQPEGKRRLSGDVWARGLRLKKGDFLH